MRPKKGLIKALSCFFLVGCTPAHSREIKILQRYNAWQPLKYAKQFLPQDPVILEAGAFNGADTIKMKTIWPASTIHTFEPDPRNFITLQEKIAGASKVYCYELALSDKNGTAIFNQSYDIDHPTNHQSGSLLAPKDHLNFEQSVTFSNRVEVITMTADSWAQLYGVTKIDFLWLDMQGSELIALKAAKSILKSVKVIFTEVEFVEAYAGQPLYAEVKTWLENEGFTLVAKDFQDNEKDRWYGNILMVRLP